MMGEILEFLLVFLRQFAGGPGPPENNLVRFGLSAMLWAALWVVAWNRNRAQDLPREKLLVWGFGLGFAREVYMLWQTASHILISSAENSRWEIYHPPLEHTLSMAAVVVVAGAFLLYVLDDRRLSNRFIQIGLGITIGCFLVTSFSWPRVVANNPGILFHQSWQAWLFHILSSILIAIAIFLLSKQQGWLRNVVILALSFFFLGEFFLLLNYASDRAYSQIICPIGNAFHILAIPLLGYVYLREQSIEKRLAEKKLEEYSEQLEDQVKDRTASLVSVNKQLKREIFKREKAESALEQLAQQNELILDTAGEGICDLDVDGKLGFINPAAARMLGYRVDELVGRSGEQFWYNPDVHSDPSYVDEHPIYKSYHQGIAHQTDDQVFWRKNKSSFPVRYISSPTYIDDQLSGAVLVFRDITERKHAEQEIAERNARLAAQNAVAATLSQSLELETILNDALDTVLSVLELEVGLIFLIDRDTGALRLQIYRGGVSLQLVSACIHADCPYLHIAARAVGSLRAVSQKISDYPQDTLPNFIKHEQLHMLVSTPMVSKGRVFGAMTLGYKGTETIHQNDMELLTAIGQQIGMAIENAQLYLDAGLYAEELDLLHQVSLTLSSTLDPDEIHEEMAKQSARLTGCSKVAVIQHDKQDDDYQVVSSIGLSADQVGNLREFAIENDFMTRLSQNPTTTVIRRSQDDQPAASSLMLELELQTMVCLPIVGVRQPQEFLLLLDHRKSHRWKQNEIELIESFINRAAIALDNAFLHQQIEWAAALEERHRIAADMHDGLAQTLSLLGLKVDQTEDYLHNGTKNSAIGELQEVRTIVEQASADVRRSIASLHEVPPPPVPLQTLLMNLLEQYFSPEEQSIEFVCSLPSPLYLSNDHQAQVLPIVQEALINAHRHAQAGRISLVVEQAGEFIKIVVEDDGIGFDTSNVWEDSRSHFGLQIMRARAARLGGYLKVKSALNGGTIVALIWKPEKESSKVTQALPTRAASRPMVEIG